MSWFRSLSITHKILTFAGIVFLLACIGQLIAHSSLEQAKKRMSVLYEGHLQSITGLVSAEAALNASELELQKILAASDPERRLLLREVLEKRSRSADQALTSFASGSLDPESSLLAEGLLKSWNEYRELRFKGLQLAVNMRDSEARAILDGTALKPLSRVRTALSGLIRANADSGEAFLSESLLRTSRSQSILWVVLVLSALCAACLGLWMAGLFERPLAEIRSILRQLASGESEISLRSLEEENLHDLKAEIAALVSSQQSLDLTLKQLARGEPGSPAPLNFQHGSINQTVATLKAAMEKVLAASRLLQAEHGQEEESTCLNPMGLYGNWRDILRNIEGALKNANLRSQTLSEHLGRIAKGDLPLKVETGNCALDQESLASINALIDCLRCLSSDSAQISKGILELDLNARIDTGRHGGVFKTIAENINKLMEGVSISMRGFQGEIERLAESMQQGQTSTRIDPENSGAFLKDSARRINSILDLFTSLLDGVTGILSRASEFDFSARMETSLAGDLEKTRNTLNTSIDRFSEHYSQMRGKLSNVQGTIVDLQQSCGEITSSVGNTIEDLQSASSLSSQAVSGLDRVTRGSGQIITWFKESTPRLEDAANVIGRAEESAGKALLALRSLEDLGAEANPLLDNLSGLIRQYRDTAQHITSGEQYGEDSDGMSHLRDIGAQITLSFDALGEKVSLLQEAASSSTGILAEVNEALQKTTEISQRITNAAQETVSLSSGIDRTAEESVIRGNEVAQKISSALAKIENLRERAAQIGEMAEKIKVN